MTVVQRLALVALFGFFLSALWLNFTDVDGDRTAGCGAWFNPEMSSAQASQMRDVAAESSDPEISARASAVVAAYQDCGRALESRRAMVFVLFGLAVAVPAVVLFVGAAAGHTGSKAGIG